MNVRELLGIWLWFWGIPGSEKKQMFHPRVTW